MDVLFAEKTQVKDKKTKTLKEKANSCGFSSCSEDREPGLQVLATGHADTLTV